MKRHSEAVDTRLQGRAIGRRSVRGMATGAIVTSGVCLLAFAGVVTAFMKTSSPYVTISEARNSDADGLHVEGDVQQATVRQVPSDHLMIFDVKDAHGDTMQVDYNGVIPENFSEAHKVVAIGHMKGGHFESDKLLVKCPSKYEAKGKS